MKSLLELEAKYDNPNTILKPAEGDYVEPKHTTLADIDNAKIGSDWWSNTWGKYMHFREGQEKALVSSPQFFGNLVRHVGGLVSPEAEKAVSRMGPQGWVAANITKTGREALENKFPGLKDFNDSVRDRMTSFSNTLLDVGKRVVDRNRDWVEDVYPTPDNDPDKFFQDVGAGAFSAGLAIVLMSLGGGPLVLTGFGLAEGSDKFSELYDAEVGIDKALVGGALSGFMEGSIESISTYLMWNATVPWLARGGMNAVLEGAEEFAQTLSSETVSRIFGSREDMKGVLGSALYSGAIGLLVGGPSGMIVAASQRKRIQGMYEEMGMSKKEASIRANKDMAETTTQMLDALEKDLFSQLSKEKRVLWDAITGRTLTTDARNTLEDVYQRYIDNGLIKPTEKDMTTQEKAAAMDEADSAFYKSQRSRSDLDVIDANDVIGKAEEIANRVFERQDIKEALAKVRKYMDAKGVKAGVEYVDEELPPLDWDTPEGQQYFQAEGITKEQYDESIRQGTPYRVFGIHETYRGEDGERRSKIRFFRGFDSREVYHEYGHAFQEQGLAGKWQGTQEEFAHFVEKAFAEGREDIISEFTEEGAKIKAGATSSMGVEDVKASVRNTTVNKKQAEKEMNKAQVIKEDPSVLSWWNKIYAEAKKIPAANILEFKSAKLEGVATVHLTRNCQRSNFIRIMKKLGMFKEDMEETSCYAGKYGGVGSCYKDRTSYSKRTVKGVKQQKEASVAEKQIAFATPEGIAKVLSNKNNVKKINKAKFVRLGQAGDDSHAIYNGLAVEWLRQAKAAGVTAKSVFVTSSYAPTTRAMYEALYPYKEMFIIHVTESGAFTRQEIFNRFNEFVKANNAKLNVKMRVITNKDMISAAENKGEIGKVGPMAVEEEPLLFKMIDDYKINNVVLETPYHNDFLHQRSDETGRFKNTCCSTGKCISCPATCLIKQGMLKAIKLDRKDVAKAQASLRKDEQKWYEGTRPFLEVLEEKRNELKSLEDQKTLPGYGVDKGFTKDIDDRIKKLEEELRTHGDTPVVGTQPKTTVKGGVGRQSISKNFSQASVFSSAFIKEYGTEMGGMTDWTKEDDNSVFELKEVEIKDLLKNDPDIRTALTHKDASLDEPRDTSDIDAPIIVNSRNEVIDGWHRVKAKMDAGETTIDAYVGQPKTQASIRKEAFYTKTERAIQDLKQETVSAEQAKAQIAKFGKKADLDQQMLEDFLKTKKKFTKAELLDFVQKNRLRFEVDVAGEPATYSEENYEDDINDQIAELKEDYDDGEIDEDSYEESLAVLEEQLDNPPEGATQREPGQTKWSKYVLGAGGENYREIKFSLPQEDVSYDFILADQKRILRETIKEREDWLNKPRSELDRRQVAVDNVKQFINNLQKQLDLLDREGARGLTVAQIKGYERDAKFTSHAFDEPNVFSWIRADERKTVDGEKVLFVEESQKVNPQVDRITEEQYKNLPAFANTSNTLFQVKQMIEEAVRSGAKIVAWTTGQQQTDRYDLRQQVDSIEWMKHGDGTHSIMVWKGKESIAAFNDLDDAELTRTIGKDAAEKIINSTEDGELKGIDLKVGGERLKQYYDKNLPREAEKYIKKMDPEAKVEMFEFEGVKSFREFPKAQSYEQMVRFLEQGGELWQEMIEDDDLAGIETEEDLEDIFDGGREFDPKSDVVRLVDKDDVVARTQPGFRITPKMEQIVKEEGQPLASVRKQTRAEKFEEMKRRIDEIKATKFKTDELREKVELLKEPLRYFKEIKQSFKNQIKSYKDGYLKEEFSELPNYYRTTKGGITLDEGASQLGLESDMAFRDYLIDVEAQIKKIESEKKNLQEQISENANKKIIKSELQYLKDKLSAYQQGKLEGKKEQQAVTKHLGQIMKKVLPPHERGKALSILQNVTGRNFAKSLARIENIYQDYQIKVARTKAAKKIIKGYKHPENVLDVRYQEVIDNIREKIGKNVTERRKAIKDMSTDELVKLSRQIAQLEEKGKKIFKTRKENMAMAREIMRAATIKASGGTVDPMFIGSLEEKEAKSKAKALGVGFTRPLQLIRNIFGKFGEEVFYDTVDYSETIKGAGIFSRMDALQKAFQKHISKDGFFGDLTGQHELGSTITIDDHTLQLNDVLSLYAQMNNEKGLAAILHGNNLSEETFRKFIDYMKENHPNYLAFADEAKKIVGDRYEAARREMEQVFNIKMPKEVDYWPMFRVRVDAQADPEQKFALDLISDADMKTKGGIDFSSAPKGFTIARVDISERNQMPISLDFMGDAIRAIETQEHFINYAKIQKMYHQLQSDEALRLSVTYNHGVEAWSGFNDWMNQAINPRILMNKLDPVSKHLRHVRKALGLSYLGFNLVTAMKQFPSAHLALPYTSLPQLYTSMARVVASPELREKIFKLDPTIKNRVLNRDISDFQKKYPQLAQNDIVRGLQIAHDQMGKHAFDIIMMMDKWAVLAVYDSVYEHQRKKVGDKEARKIAHKAVLETQPQGRMIDLPTMYKTNIELMRMTLMFTNQLNQIWNMGVHNNVQDFKSGNYQRMAVRMASIMVSSFLIYLASHGGKWPEDEEDQLTALFDAILGSSIASVPLIGNMALSLGRGYTPSLNPADSIIESMKYSAYKWKNEEYASSVIETLVNVGILAGIGFPTSQPRRTIKGILSLLDGDSDDKRRLIWSKGALNE
jgi:hypothetical protein